MDWWVVLGPARAYFHLQVPKGRFSITSFMPLNTATYESDGERIFQQDAPISSLVPSPYLRYQ
jgi:hypothetical protein